MNSRSKYESQSIITLLRDVSEKVRRTQECNAGLFSMMNDLVIESVTQGLWRYNTPTLMITADLLNEAITRLPRGDTPLIVAMDGYTHTINDHSRDPNIVLELINETIARVQLEMNL